MKLPEIERFWAKVSPEPNSGCWLWIGACIADGYGSFGASRAHRWAYEHFVGPIPSGLHVCHKCDVRCCVNPDHLFVGTSKDNVADMWRKGRNAWACNPSSRARGERVSTAKLTSQIVISIRKRCVNGESQYQLAKEFGVSSGTLWAIVHRKSWAHVKEADQPEG